MKHRRLLALEKPIFKLIMEVEGVIRQYAKVEAFAVVWVKYCQKGVGHMEFAFDDSFSLFVKGFMFDTVKEACLSRFKIS